MKEIRIKCIKVSSHGTINFSLISFLSFKQVIFYEKDVRSLEFFNKHKKSHTLLNTNKTSYKSKYKF